MPIRYLSLGLLVVIAGGLQPARADTLVATRPGVMCSSADALARLILPDGSSRTAAPTARPEDFTTKQQGGCIDIPQGARVSVQTARKLTSIVLFDAHDGAGTRSFVIPNADFGPGGASPAAAGRDCLSYDVPITMRGTVTIGSSYGEDIHTGKIGTSHWRQITLDQPICTRENPAMYEDAEQNVRSMQPVWLGTGPYPFIPGKTVTVEGKLFHQDNGNQMTKVLIQVDRLVSDR